MPTTTNDATPGTLALVGGAEWQAGCEFDADLLGAAGVDEVLVVPTASAYEHPEHIVAGATTWFEGLGAACGPSTCSVGATPPTPLSSRWHVAAGSPTCPAGLRCTCARS